MIELKKLTRDGIAPALEKAEKYRLLNEPVEAESICRDILAVEPGNQRALVTLFLAQTDLCGSARERSEDELRQVIVQLQGDYEKAYYAGIMFERKAKAKLESHAPGSRGVAFSLFSRALERFENAEKLRPAGNDDALLRWNTCARIIAEHRLESAPGESEKSAAEFELE